MYIMYSEVYSCVVKCIVKCIQCTVKCIVNCTGQRYKCCNTISACIRYPVQGEISHVHRV